MNNVTITVEVALSEATRTFLSELFNKLMASLTVAANPTVLHEAVKTQPDEQPAVAEAPAPAAAPAMPLDDLPVSKKDLSDSVKKAQKERGVKPAAIKAVFAEFGIGCSSDCPEDRMEELWNRIEAL